MKRILNEEEKSLLQEIKDIYIKTFDIVIEKAVRKKQFSSKNNFRKWFIKESQKTFIDQKGPEMLVKAEEMGIVDRTYTYYRNIISRELYYLEDYIYHLDFRI